MARQTVSMDIERLECPTREQFVSQHLNRNKPVLITGVMDRWPAMSKWNVDYLKSVAGNAEITTHFNEDGDFHRWYVHPKTRQDVKLPFGKFLDLVSDPGDRRYYMTEHSLRQISPELVPDVDLGRYLDPCPPWEPLLFVGFDTCMPMHIHGTTEAFLCQIIGTKKITLFSPEQYSRLYPVPWYGASPLFSTLDGRKVQAGEVDLEKYPKFEKAVPMQFTLRPGEILFIPVHWWHLTSVPGFQVSMTHFWKARVSNWTFPVPGIQMTARSALYHLQRAARLGRGPSPTATAYVR